MKIIQINFLTVAFLVFLLNCAPGCRSPGAYVARDASKFDFENSEKFVLLDKGASKSVTCTGLNKTTLDDGRLLVVANVMNLEERRIHVQINCVFKDAQGFPTGDETPFQTLILSENAQEGVRFTSMNDRAKDFTVRVRQAR